MEQRASLLSIGDELLLGQIAERNLPWLAQALLELGFVVAEYRTVADDERAIAAALSDLAARGGVVIATGGLGPTDDDLTRQALALAMGGVALEEEQSALDALEKRFRRRGVTMPALNRRQALCPQGARLIPNPNGTAPGIAARLGETWVYCLPGPPNEMIPMARESVLPELSRHSSVPVATMVIHSCGIGEAAAAELLGNLMQRDQNPLVGTTASGAVVSARVRGWGAGATPEAMARVRESIESAWGPYVYGSGTTTLAEALGQMLVERGLVITTAESCTGGGMAEFVTSAAGASAWFGGGIAAYSNALKTRLLDVESALVEGVGAVSREVAEAMSVGALERTGADIALSTTGIAGPTGGSEAKPVGTVWIGLAKRGREGTRPSVSARHFRFSGDREGIRLRTTRIALQWARQDIIGLPDVPLLWEQVRA